MSATGECRIPSDPIGSHLCVVGYEDAGCRDGDLDERCQGE